MTTTTTPRPWRLLEPADMVPHIMGADHARVALMDSAYPGDRARQDGALIVAAVNAYQPTEPAADPPHDLATRLRLLAALQKMLDVQSRRRHPLGQPDEGIAYDAAAAASEARAVIAAATAGAAEPVATSGYLNRETLSERERALSDALDRLLGYIEEFDPKLNMDWRSAVHDGRALLAKIAAGEPVTLDR